MLFNRRADWIAGGGGLQGSHNGAYYPFPTYGGGSWLDDDTVLLQLQSPAPGTMATYKPLTGALATLVPHQMANDFAANGGRYIGWLSGTGCFGSLGPNPDAGTAGQHSVSRDGTIAYIPNRSIGYGLVVTAPDGSSVSAPGIVPYDVQALSPGVAIWRGGAIGRPAPKPAVADAQGIVLANLAGTDWLLYWSPTLGVVLQPDGSANGYILLPLGGLAYNRDLVATLSGQLWVGWSRTQGEAPTDIVSFQADLSKPMQPLIAPPAVITQPTFHFTHPVLVRPFFADGSGVPDLFTEGTYSSSETLPSPMPVNRLLLAHDSATDWTLPKGLRDFDVPMIEFYRLKSETLAQSADRWNRQAQSLLMQWPHTCGCIPMFYCQGGAAGSTNPPELWTVQEVLDGLGYLSGLVNISSRLTLIAPFAYKRANGVTAHAEFQTAFNNLLTAEQKAGQATLPPVVTPIPPQPIPPNPIPPTPQEPSVLYLDSTKPVIQAIYGDSVDNGNGTISIRKSNGKFVCLTPDGNWEERDNPGGPWESFKRGANGLVANRDWGTKTVTYIVPFVEAN